MTTFLATINAYQADIKTALSFAASPAPSATSLPSTVAAGLFSV